MSWTQMRTKVLHTGPYVSLHRDEVLQPDGKPGTYEHISVNDGVRVAAFNTKAEVLLVEDDFYLQRRRVLHLPGGSTDGQHPHTAAQRELAEETGFTADHLVPLGTIDPLPATTAARTHLFLATGLHTGPPRRDDTEAGMTVGWVAFSEAIDAVLRGDITEAGSVAALLIAKLRGNPS